LSAVVSLRFLALLALSFALSFALAAPSSATLRGRWYWLGSAAPAAGALLLVDGSSNLLLVDGTDNLLLVNASSNLMLVDATDNLLLVDATDNLCLASEATGC
jgi:hypothetical protein